MTEESLAALGILYKYRDSNNKYHWELLEKQELFLPNPRSFNDPFDANIGMRYDLLSNEDKIKMCDSYVRTQYPTADFFLRQHKIKELTRLMTDPESHDLMMQQWVDRLVSKMRVFCVCPERDNILLWSHYSYNHTGFAIGFDSMQLHSLWKENGGLILGHALYRKEYPELLPPSIKDAKSEEKITAIIMNLKSEVWAYEKEVRLSMFDGPEKAHFSPLLIKEVVLGCEMKEPDRNKMLKLIDAKYPHTSVYQAKKRRFAFALDFTKLRG